MAVTLAPGAEANGLASMIAGLIEQNLTDAPHKRKDFARMRGRVAIVAEDAGVAVTLVFDRGRLEVHDGIAGIPEVAVRAESDDVVALSRIGLTRAFALPNLRGAHGRAILARSKAGKIKLYGALAHPALVLRLTRLMSVG
jgi:hypothetical protein